MIGRHADTHAAADFNDIAFDDHGAREDFDNPFRHGRCSVGIAEAERDDRELVAADTCDDVAIAGCQPEPVGNPLQHKVADWMPQSVIDRLEAVEIDHQQRKRCTAIAERIAFIAQRFGKLVAIGEIGQGIMHRDMRDAVFAFGGCAAFHQIGGDAGAHDQQSDHADGGSHGCECLAVGALRISRHGGDRESRHAAEVQSDDREAKQAARLPCPVRRVVLAQQVNCSDRAAHCNRERPHDVPPVPVHDPVDPIGEHAGVMHRADREADGGATGQARNARRGGRRENQPDADPSGGHQRRYDGQHAIERHGGGRLVAEHGDEMGRPGGRPGSHCRQEAPVDPGFALVGNGLAEESRRNHRARDAHQRSHEHEPQIVFV